VSTVHGLLSLHVPPSALAQPLPMQLSTVHGLLSLQFRVPPATQLPLAQVSLYVHGSLSLQAHAPWTHLLAPAQSVSYLQTLADGLKTQPVWALQLSAVQVLLSLQVLAAPAWHMPPLQRSPVVQALPSSQATSHTPNGELAGMTQVAPALHEAKPKAPGRHAQ